MSVVLLILKIIGIVLLAVLGLVLLIVLSVLLAPVRYRIRGSLDPGISVSVRLRWLFPLVSVLLRYEEQELTQKLRVLGIPVSMGRKEPKEERRKRASRKPEEERPERAAQETEKERQQEASQRSEEERQEAAPQAEPPGQEESAKKARSRPGRAGGVLQKGKALLCMIKEKVAKLKEIVHRIFQEIRDETNQNVLRLLLREGKSLLGHYLPRKLAADVRFGMADPAVTGQLLGVLSLFPIFLRPGVLIVPDFMAEKIYVTGSFEMSGHVRAVHVLAAAFHLWREQDVKKLIQRVRNRR